MGTKTYNNESYFAESFQTFAELRQNEQTCDISIVTSNNKIRAHKLVLASASEYFKNAVYGLYLNNTSKNELKLNEVQYDILLLMVDYMYTGRIEINSENVYDIYNAADYCLMQFVKTMCLEFLMENLNADNCVKIWIMANNCKHDKLITDAADTIFSNLEISSNTSEFIDLSKDELLDLLGLWPKDKLFDSIISAALKWATNKEDWEDTFFKNFKDISFTRISDDFLENVLSHNELIQNSPSCNNWMMVIFKEKSKVYKLQQAQSESELKLKNLRLAEYEAELNKSKPPFEAELRFLADQAIIFLQRGTAGWHNFFKYNLCFGVFNIFNRIEHGSNACDCKTYKRWIYVLDDRYCKRLSFENNEYDSAFNHNHGECLKAAVLNESMHIFGGEKGLKSGTSVDLNTKQCTRFSLLHDRVWPGVAVSDGSIYICGGEKTNIVERFDPRECRTTQFGSIPFRKPTFTLAAALPNHIYLSHYEELKMMDLRNNKTWMDIKRPVESEYVRCLFASYGRLFTVLGATLYEYNNASSTWNNLNITLPHSNYTWCATSFE